MTDLLELYTTPEFAEHQNLVVDEIVSWLQQKISASPDAIPAGMELAHNILFLPSAVAMRPDVKKRVEAAIRARLVAIPAELLRREIFKY